jgi:RNA polymerase sigma-70 factor (ECF subfamily)
VQDSSLAVEPIAPPEPVPFRTLYERHFAFTWRALRYLGVPERLLDDAAQEVWVVVHRRYAEFEGRSDVKTWLFGIAVNVERNIRRVEGRRRSLVPLPAELSASRGDPLLAREGKEAWALVLSFVDTLDETRRAVFAASLVEGLSAAETAAITELPIETVYNRVRALRRSFASWVEQHRSEV